MPVLFSKEHYSPFIKGLLILAICGNAFCGFSQSVNKANQPVLKGHLRHVVEPSETFNSIGRLYGISGKVLADYNNLEFYNDPVIAKYLSIPLTTKNFSVEKKTFFNEVLVPVFRIVGTGERIVQYKKGNRNSTTGLPRKVKLARDGFLHTAKANERFFKTATPTTASTDIDSDVVAKKDTVYAAQALKADTIITSHTPPNPVVAVKNDSFAAFKKTTSPPIANNKVKEIPNNFSKPGPRPISRVEKVYFFVKIQILIAIFLVAMIFLYMIVRNRKELFKNRLNESIRKLLIDEILREDGFSTGIANRLKISEFLKKQLQKKSNRQFVIDEIINGRKNIKGKVGENFLNLYLTLQLDQESANKLKSKSWNDVAKGIQELAIMEQTHKMAEIFTEINSKNEHVRMEAQSALVRLSGFSGLWFLNVLNHPISEWQQMRLISMLSASPVSDIPDLHLLLTSPNESLVIFTLKLISVFQQRAMHDAVVKCLSNKSETIRFVAIKCLKEINSEKTANILSRKFKRETLKNKIAIVQVVGEIGDKNQIDFLLEVLASNGNTLKMAAAKALSVLGKEGNYLLEEYCSTHGDPYDQIFLHIKSVV